MPASDDQLSQFETRYQVTIPEDLRAYFREVNGTAGDYAFGIIRFWSIDEVCTFVEAWEANRNLGCLIYSRYAAAIDYSERLFLFADHLHEVHLYGTILTSDGHYRPVMLVDGGPPRLIADSFGDFVERYVSSPERLKLMVD